MLGLQGNASSSKEYRCVACSATFTGLASLLVHQATHAGSLPKPEQRPSMSNHVEASSPTSTTEENHSSKSIFPRTPMYICDCGEEFGSFAVMMDHKQSHASEGQPVNHELTVKENSTDTHCAETDEALEVDSPTSSSFKNTEEGVNQAENAAVASVSSHEGQSPVCAGPDEENDKSLVAEPMTEEMPEAAVDNDMDDTAPKNKPLMRILASAYGKHLVSPSSQGDNITMSLKEESEAVLITQQTKEPSAVTDTSTMQLKRLLGKTGSKTKAPSISRLLESSTKKIVSLTKIFSPVVLLETRQKFMDPSSDAFGQYQCSRCRRVFQDVDCLTEHHFMHKKERIKCCRCCKQLIIGRVPLPDNHVCPQSGRKTTVSPLHLKNNPTNGQKLSQINPKKVYFCPICKHNFARRYNLKMHKCYGPFSSQSEQTKPSNNAFCIGNEGDMSRSIAVGTQFQSIKVENDSEQEISNLSWASPPSLKKEPIKDSTFAPSQQVQDNQWTVPLYNEIEMFKDTNAESSAKGRRLRLSTILRDGVRRYSCDKCHKTFGLSSNLCRHKKVCSVRPKGLESQHISDCSSLNDDIPVFSCYVCGKNFNRKDNMMVHRKKCELRRTMIPNLASEIAPSLPSSVASITQDQPQEEEWSVMSLPSVLPRRVTCECGLGFTSPNLLLQHLQKHAQESYTCPTCGVTVKSWADYEIHLQLHMHPQHHKTSQHLLVQFQKHMSDLQQSQNVRTTPEPVPQPPNRLKNQNRKQPFACPKCGNSFVSRCTLRRHLTWSQCRGGGANISINYNLFSIRHRATKQI